MHRKLLIAAALEMAGGILTIVGLVMEHNARKTIRSEQSAVWEEANKEPETDEKPDADAAGS